MRLEVAYGGAEARNRAQDEKGDSNEQRDREATEVSDDAAAALSKSEK